MLTWKYSIAFFNMELFTSGENVKYVFSLKQKSFSKTLILIGTVLSKSLIDIEFANKDINQH